MKKEQIEQAYSDAKNQYAALGVDVEMALEQLDKLSITIH